MLLRLELGDNRASEFPVQWPPLTRPRLARGPTIPVGLEVHPQWPMTLFVSLLDTPAVLELDLSTGDTRHVLAGTGVPGYSGDGDHATDATLSGPTGLTVDERQMIIADSNNDVLRRVGFSDGTISTMFPHSRDAQPALCEPSDVAMLDDGRVIVSDTGNNRVLIIDAASRLTESFDLLGNPTTVARLQDGAIAVLQQTDPAIVLLSEVHGRFERVDTIARETVGITPMGFVPFGEAGLLVLDAASSNCYSSKIEPSLIASGTLTIIDKFDVTHRVMQVFDMDVGSDGAVYASVILEEDDQRFGVASNEPSDEGARLDE